VAGEKNLSRIPRNLRLHNAIPGWLHTANCTVCVVGVCGGLIIVRPLSVAAIEPFRTRGMAVRSHWGYGRGGTASTGPGEGSTHSMVYFLSYFVALRWVRKRGFSHGDMSADVGALGAGIQDNVLAPIAAAHEVRHRPGVLSPQLARHSAVRPLLSRETNHVMG
jgi:hypothetical protein